MSRALKTALTALIASACVGAPWAQAQAPAQAPAAPPPPAVKPHGPHGHGQGHAPGQGHRGGPLMALLGPELDRALDAAKATPQQRADIRNIAGAARDDLRAARQAQAPNPSAWMNAWTAEQLDLPALEQERQRRLAAHEQRSKRVLQAVADIGAVLSPAQRRAVAEHWRARPRAPQAPRGGPGAPRLGSIEAPPFDHAAAAAD